MAKDPEDFHLERINFKKLKVRVELGPLLRGRLPATATAYTFRANCFASRWPAAQLLATVQLPWGRVLGHRHVPPPGPATNRARAYVTPPRHDAQRM